MILFRVFTCSVVRLGFQREFFAADSSWELRNVWICTIVERNMANVIADLPAIYTLAHSWHRKILSNRNNTSQKNDTPMGRTKNSSSKFASTSRFTAHSVINSKPYETFRGDYNDAVVRPDRLERKPDEDDGSSTDSFGSRWIDGSAAGDGTPLRALPPPRHSSERSTPGMEGKGIVVQTDIDVTTRQQHDAISETEQAFRLPSWC